MFKKVIMSVLYFALFSPLYTHAAEEQPANNGIDYQYFALEPDIITNYIKSGRQIGFIRVSVELLVNSSMDYSAVEMHAPIIRDRIITVLGEQNEKEIKSFSEREAIRLRCLLEVNEVLSAVIDARPVQDLHFTKYMYQ
jgi:flagellar FliL protein